MYCLKNGFFILFLAIFFVFGQISPDDLSLFEADISHSQPDMGTIEALIDPIVPQQAVLSAYRNVRNAAGLNLAKNMGLNHVGLASMAPDTAAVLTIKESISIVIKNDIPLKLRI